LSAGIVDPYHSSGTDVRLCLFCVLSGADKELATGRPFVQVFTSRPRYPETQQVLGSIVLKGHTQLKIAAAF
jgi:hypothetical protein